MEHHTKAVVVVEVVGVVVVAVTAPRGRGPAPLVIGDLLIYDQ
jgi:hypothetical protein